MKNLESIESLTKEAKAILELEKLRADDSHIPTEELAQQLSQTLGFSVLNVPVSLPVTAAPPTPAVATASGLTSMVVTKSVVHSLALVLAGATIGGISVYGVMSSKPRDVVETPSVAVPAPTPQPEPKPEVLPPPRPEAAVVKKVTPLPAPKKSAAVDRLSEENLLMERARTALLRGSADAALKAVIEHSRLFEEGVLIEERDALWVQSLAQMGNLEEAQKKAEAFRVKYPKSLLIPVGAPYFSPSP